MTVLHQQLNTAGLSHLSLSPQQHETMMAWIQAESASYDERCKQLANHGREDVLLGFLTVAVKAYQQQLDTHAESMQAMDGILSGYLGEQGYRNNLADEAEIVATLWFMYQGYRAIDYSLAIEYAMAMVESLTRAGQGQGNALRERFMGAYYEGDKCRPRLSWRARLKAFICRS
ncbi:hypothetical protein [Thaumasiovibrio sp. DFM-14]|uniref:hypothetical protein n=1 Tax=Thaumasiovibrio sp. DFM-14 TaxID=3384792 RepID=UPI0039A3ADF4